MLRFQKLEVGGYKSWGWPAITIDLNSGGVNQIAGDNASGKTNLIECFYWVLTGKQIKGLKVDKVINWRHRKKGAFGATELLSNGDHYRIERYRGHPRHQNALLLFKDGVPEAEDRPQEELDRLIGLAPDELLASIVFSAEDFKNIIEMPVDKRRNFMERMFGVDRFDKASVQAVEERRRIKREIVVVEHDINRFADETKEEKSRLILLRQEVENWQRTHLDEIEALQKAINVLEGIDRKAVLQAWDARDQKKQIVKRAQDVANECQTRLNAAREIANNAAQPIPDPLLQRYREARIKEKGLLVESEIAAKNYNEAKEKCDNLMSEWSAAKVDLDSLQKDHDREIEKLTDLKDKQNTAIHAAGQAIQTQDAAMEDRRIIEEESTCPTCNQILPKEQLVEQLTASDQRLASIAASISACERSLSEINDKIAAQKSHVADLSAKLELDAQIVQGKKEAADIENKRVLELRDKLQDVNKRIADLEMDEVPPQSELDGQDKIRERWDQITANVASLTKELEQKNKEQSDLEVELDMLPEPQYTREQIASQETELQGKKEALQRMKAEKNPHAIAQHNAELRIHELGMKLKEVNTKAGDLREELMYIDHLATGFQRDMRIAVLRQMIPSFNRFVFDSLSFLLPVARLGFDEEMNCDLFFENQLIEDPKELNTGSRARINLAIALATYAVIKSVRKRVAANVVFYDEVLDIGLDGDGERAAMDLLRSLPQTVYVISHSARLAEEFDTAIDVNRLPLQDSQMIVM